MKKTGYHTFFTNLSNPLKISLILSLKENKQTVNELKNSLKVEQSKISHALACLKQCKIVLSEKKGKQRVYSLNKKTIIPILKILDKHSMDFCKKNQCCGCIR